MSEIGLIAPLGGIVLIALFYMRRVSDGPAATAWGAAWLSLYVAGTVASLAEPPVALLAASRVIGSLFPALVLGGALALRREGPVPRWSIGVGLALGLVRAGLHGAGAPELALWIAIPVELPMMLGAAVTIWRGAREQAPSFAEELLSPALVLLAIVNTIDPAARALALPMLPVLLAWVAVAFVVAMLQIAVFVERGRQREHRLLLEHDLLHRITRSAAESTARAPLLETTTTAVAEAGWFDAFGVWLLDPDGRLFECAARTRTARALGPEFQRFRADMPLLGDALRADGPTLIAADLGWRDSRFADIGVGALAAVPLRAHGRLLGLVLAGLAPQRSFHEAEWRVLGALAHELALVLAHIDAVEESLRQARAQTRERQRLLALLEAVPVGILVVDRDDRITMLSSVGAAQLGLGDPDAWIGRGVYDTVSSYAPRLAPDSAARLGRALAETKGGAFDEFELRFDKPEPSVVSLSARVVPSRDGEPAGRVFVSRDVTAERELAVRMQRAQRMETLGTLASGIAHDFNNQLTAILGNARVLAEHVPEEPVIRSALGDLENAAEHCAELTRGLLDLARARPAERRAVAIEPALQEVEALLRVSLEPGVRLRVAPAPGLHAWADPGQLRRVLTNLAVNARDAVGNAGEIELSAHEVDPSPDGRRLEIRIRDDGAGMSEATLERAFEPFYTTKPEGQGTGLGLAIVSRIVAAHGASIEVESRPGAGTCFRLLWPAARATAVRPDSEPKTPDVRMSVLLAEDDPGVRRLARATLERAGHRVLVACDGDEAATLFARHRDEIGLLVLDLAMPGQSGTQLLAAIRRAGARVPAVLMTGYGGLATPAAGDAIVLEKPFRPADLSRATQRAIAGAPALDADA